MLVCGETERITINTANAIFGDNTFGDIESAKTGATELVELEDEEVCVFVTATPYFYFCKSMEDHVHRSAVIIIGEILPDLTVSFPALGDFLMRADSEENLFKRSFFEKKCVVILTGRDRFQEAQNRQEINVGFTDWCRQNKEKTFQSLYRLVKGRFVLFDVAGTEEVLQEQRTDLFAMIRLAVKRQTVLPEAELKAIELENKFADLKEAVQKVELEIETYDDVASRLRSLETQISQISEEIVMDKAERDVEIQSIRKEKGSKREKSPWHTIRSVPLFQSAQTSPRRFVYLSLLLLFLLLLPLLSMLNPQKTNRRREIGMLDDNLELRRYMDLKLDQSAKKIQEMSKQLAEMNNLFQKHIRTPRNETLIESDGASTLAQDMEERFSHLNDRLMEDLAEAMSEFRNTSRQPAAVVWDMIQSLPVSLPLVMVLTLLLLLLLPVPLPHPLPELLALLLVALVILQLLLLLVLLDV